MTLLRRNGFLSLPKALSPLSTESGFDLTLLDWKSIVSEQKRERVEDARV